MEKYYIKGGNRLFGEVKIQPAKNSVVALLSASILAKGGVFINACPNIIDVRVMIQILESLGAEISFKNGGLSVNCDKINSPIIPQTSAQEVRASFFLVGALLSRFGYVEICEPGGCNIGERPVDIHIDGLKKLGATVIKDGRVMKFNAKKLVGADIELKYPSVGATENLMIASTLAMGKTTITNCAKEPEVVDLALFLNRMGAKIKGAGTNKIEINGSENFKGGFDFSPVFDRIEAGTFLLATAGCGGETTIYNVKVQNILPLIEKLKDNACKLYYENDIIYIKAKGDLSGFGSVVTAPYPGFPTDLQPLLGATASIAFGETTIRETVFESRFCYAEELKKLKANVKVEDSLLTILGTKLQGSKLIAPDLRGGAALCLASLFANGYSELDGIRHIERGYYNFVEKLSSLGADIVKK